jgi:hypothetical protein
MNNLKAICARAVVCMFAVAVVAMTTAVPGRAATYQLPFDPTGGSYSQTTISGTLATRLIPRHRFPETCSSAFSTTWEIRSFMLKRGERPT